MYGYFKCSQCGLVWESAHTYPRVPDGSTYYQQKCKQCDVYCSPYRVKPTVCSKCGLQSNLCRCSDKKSDPNKPHLSDLCEKCQSGRPCQRF